MNAYREHVQAELIQTSTLDMVVAVMCDQTARSIPTIQRAIREMNGYEATHKEINTALKCVEERGWSIARCKITRMPMLFRLVKA